MRTNCYCYHGRWKFVDLRRGLCCDVQIQARNRYVDNNKAKTTILFIIKGIIKTHEINCTDQNNGMSVWTVHI